MMMEMDITFYALGYVLLRLALLAGIGLAFFRVLHPGPLPGLPAQHATLISSGPGASSRIVAETPPGRRA